MGDGFLFCMYGNGMVLSVSMWVTIMSHYQDWGEEKILQWGLLQGSNPMSIFDQKHIKFLKRRYKPIVGYLSLIRKDVFLCFMWHVTSHTPQYRKNHIKSNLTNKEAEDDVFFVVLHRWKEININLNGAHNWNCKSIFI